MLRRNGRDGRARGRGGGDGRVRRDGRLGVAVVVIVHGGILLGAAEGRQRVLL